MGIKNMDLVASQQAPNPGPNGVSSTPFAAFDASRVVDYLSTQLQVTLGAEKHELEAPGSLLSKASYQDTIQRCTRFASDTQTALYIQKEPAPVTELENGSAEDGAADPSICSIVLLWL
jgi:dynein heavy chain 1